jgi:hypothetical protein
MGWMAYCASVLQQLCCMAAVLLLCCVALGALWQWPQHHEGKWLKYQQDAPVYDYSGWCLQNVSLSCRLRMKLIAQPHHTLVLFCCLQTYLLSRLRMALIAPAASPKPCVVAVCTRCLSPGCA